MGFASHLLKRPAKLTCPDNKSHAFRLLLKLGGRKAIVTIAINVHPIMRKICDFGSFSTGLPRGNSLHFRKAATRKPNSILLWRNAAEREGRLEDLYRRRIGSAECGSKYFQAGGSNVLIKFCDAFGVTAQ